MKEHQAGTFPNGTSNSAEPPVKKRFGWVRLCRKARLIAPLITIASALFHLGFIGLPHHNQPVCPTTTVLVVGFVVSESKVLYLPLLE